MMSAVLQYIAFLVILVVLAVPLGKYSADVMDGNRVFLSPILSPVEKLIYKLTGVRKDEEMTWKTYLVCVLYFFFIGMAFLFVFQMLQDKLPFNPQNIDPMSWHLSFNTAASFAANTD